MDDRFNTIAGWVLGAGIVALGASIVAGEMFHSERPEQMGYPIEGVVQEGEGAAEAEKPIAFYLASADSAAGEQVFKKCTACHNADQGGANALGPNLWDVLGEPVGKGKGFPFSPALSGVGGTWNWDNMSEWLKSPKKFAPGTKMTFAGLSNPQVSERRRFHDRRQRGRHGTGAAGSAKGRGRACRRQARRWRGRQPGCASPINPYSGGAPCRRGGAGSVS